MRHRIRGLRSAHVRNFIGAYLLVPLCALQLAVGVAAPHANAQTSAGSGTGAARSLVIAPSALRPGDGLRIRIFREPELSGEFVVDERGIVVLPKLGEWKATGVPADSVRPQLVAAYKKYLTTDAIEITPFRRVAITGAVLKPGLYPIDPSMSVGEAIVLAGGVAPGGRRDKVELRRAGAREGAPLPSESRLWDTDANGVEQVYVPPQSWIRRNLTTTVTVGVSLITAITLLSSTSR